jgi:uncharacterized protein DUF326
VRRREHRGEAKGLDHRNRALSFIGVERTARHRLRPLGSREAPLVDVGRSSSAPDAGRIPRGTNGLARARWCLTPLGRGEKLVPNSGRRVMTHAQQMLATHPRRAAIESGALLACIEACFDCAQSCTACADACLGEDDVGMLIRCIRLCQDCGDVCTTTGRILSRQTEFVAELARAVVQACAQACRTCGEECERHADHHEHCRVCAEACRRCEEACEEALAALAA